MFSRQTSHRRISLLLLVLSVVQGLALILEQFLICRPLSSAWSSSFNSSCGNEITAYIVFEVFGLVLDLAIVSQPIYGIWKMNLRTKRKMGILVVFTPGLL